MIAYQYKTLYSNYLNLTQPSTSFTGTVANFPTRPNYIVIVPVKAERQTMASHIDAYDNLDITQMAIIVNNKRYPFNTLGCDFANNDYAEAVASLRRVFGTMNEVTGKKAIITYENFATYPIFCFNIAESGEQKLPSLNNVPTRVDVQMSLKSAYNHNVTLYCFGMADKAFIVNGTSNVTKLVY